MIEAVPEDILDAAQSFLAMDGTKHSALRRLVSSVFTPRQVSKIQDQIKAQATQIVDELLSTKEGDFVEQVSKRLPMWAIYEMMGLPAELRDEAAHNADGMVSWADEDVAAGRESGQVLNDSLVGLLTAGLELAEERRSHPTSDLMSQLVQAEVDGRKLTDDELGAFFVLLSVAGNDTTRNTITLATMALQEFPEQRALLDQDYDGLIKPAMEEFVRWASPVMSFRRTATRDTVHPRSGDQAGRVGHADVLVGQPGRQGVHRSGHIRHSTKAQQPCRIRWRWAALLHGQLPGQDAAGGLLPATDLPRPQPAAGAT